jgi:hypothetical protein
MAGDDDTVRIRPAPVMSRRKPPWWLYGAAAVAVLIGAAGGAYAYFGRSPNIPILVQSEAQIDATQPCGIEVSRFAADPDIVVIDFPTLTVQGLMLDRVAALVEKAGLPRGRVLDDAALTQAIYNCGDTIESYYYGHDYQAADLRRFFALADADGVTLNKREIWLRGLLRQLGWLEPGANGAIITLPASGGPVDPGMRAVILHHELSHGAFYTDPAYAAYATAFWNSLTAADQAAFTAFLGRQGYDTGNTRLMLNETQAYLIFTRDPRFFNAAAVGMTDAALATLRAGFIAGMPNFWLTPMANAALPNAGQAPGASCQSGSGQ